MRTEFRVVGDEAWFVIQDLPERYYEVVRALYFERLGGGFVRRFPATSRHLALAYEHFARHVEEFILQHARELAVPWEAALEALLRAIDGQDLDWYLVGSVALAVRGLAVVPGDVDLVTDAEGAQRLGDLLLDALIEPVRTTTGWVGDWFGRAFLHASVEWVGGVSPTVDDPLPTDFGPTAAARLETVHWRDYTLRIPPLDLQLAVSERRGLADRVALIRGAMVEQDG